MSNLLNVVERVAEMIHKNQPKQPSETISNGSNDTAPLLLYRIPKSIVRAASERYRILETRVPLGSMTMLPRGLDSAERRAAVLLEYCSRSTPESATPLSWSTVGAAIHVTKTSTLQQLSQSLAHFMQPSQTTASHATTTTTDTTTTDTPDARGARRGRTHRSNNHATVVAYVPTILPQLVIRLSGFFLDPHGVQHHTIRLLQGVYAYYDGPHTHTAVERRGHWYDLQRYAAAYEAAALFCVAQTCAPPTSTYAAPPKRKATSQPKPSRKFRKTRDAVLVPDDDDDDNEPTTALAPATTTLQRPLQLSDVIEAANNDFTNLELKQVLPHVQELARQIQQRHADATVTAATSKQRSAAAHRTQPTKCAKVNHTETNASLRGGTLEHSVPVRNGSDIQDTARNVRRRSTPTVSLRQWKDEVLQAARAQARASVPPNDEEPTWSDAKALSVAADAVLQRYGIIAGP